MKIRRKISLIFTALSTIVLFFAFAFIYYLSARNTQTDFYTRLQEKATLTAWKYFEKDELSNPAYNDVIDTIAKTMNKRVWKIHVPSKPVVSLLRFFERIRLPFP